MERKSMMVKTPGRVKRQVSCAGVIRAVALCSLLASIAGPAGAQPVRSSQGPWAKGRIIVMPRAGLPEEELARMLRPHGGAAKRLGRSNLYLVELPPSASEQAVAAQLNHNPHLKFAELDHIHAPAFVPNDPYHGSAWHLPRIGAPAAWDIAQGYAVTVAILDSGVDGAHPDLVNRLVAGWNFYDNNSNTADVYGHGTKVAGAAAASTNNAVGVAGVAGQARIMPLRITDLSGAGYSSMIASALAYAADRGVRVANISFANQPSRAAVVSAADYMKSKGGLVFVSAGNSGAEALFTPTTAMIPVGSTDGADGRSSFSSYGSYVSLAAPGEGIYSTVNGGGYAAVSGTSFSSPVAAGVAALVMSAKPTLTSTQVENLLFSTAVDLGAAGKDPYFGHGRVDAASAVQAAVGGPVATPDSIPPSVSISNPAPNATVSGLTNVDVVATDNVGVARVELRVNGALIATDTSAPYAFTWDTTSSADGMASAVAHAFDAAGNAASSTVVSVNVSNAASTTPPPVTGDTVPPSVQILSPTGGTVRGKGGVAISASASDNGGAAGIRQTLFIDGKLVASVNGGSLSYTWNAGKSPLGLHTIKVTATDAAGNAASVSTQVTTVR